MASSPAATALLCASNLGSPVIGGDGSRMPIAFPAAASPVLSMLFPGLFFRKAQLTQPCLFAPLIKHTFGIISNSASTFQHHHECTQCPCHRGPTSITDSEIRAKRSETILDMSTCRTLLL
eukprot:5108651-Alexandrium_andersonii.AAC.2